METVNAPASGAGRSASSVCAISSSAPCTPANRLAPLSVRRTPRGALEQRDAHALFERLTWCDTAVGVTASPPPSLKLQQPRGRFEGAQRGHGQIGEHG